MKVPARDHLLAAGVTCDAREVDLRVWQAHVLKHPFGMGALLGSCRTSVGTRRLRVWNAEGWDRTRPPAITVELRRQVAQSIKQLEVEGAVCRMPRIERENYGGEAPSSAEPCYECPPALATRCEEITRPVGEAYRALTEDTLSLLEHPQGVLVRRLEVSRAVLGLLRRPERLAGLAILSFGWRRHDSGSRLVGRLNRWDGMRVQFYLRGRTLTWRTTHRCPVDGCSCMRFLLDLAETPFAGTMKLPLSDDCLVPRSWWQEGRVSA